MSIEELIKKEEKYLANVYSRYEVAFTMGRGVYLYDTEGREYLDFIAGIATVNLGHCHESVVEAVSEQLKKLMHTSNLYYIIPQIEVAEILYEITKGFKSFFCNSGAEANEAAIKLARRYTGKKEIIATVNSFHGRTLGSLSATGQEKYKKPFEPLVPGFKHVEFNNIEALERAISRDTAAVILEPIQGEGGVIVPDDDYLRAVREICDEKNVLLILDEVQTGMGRTGEIFAYMLYKAEPDIFTLAKALGNGFPIGAMLAREEVMNAFKKGDHASTFGGNFLACTAAKATLSVLLKEKIYKNAEKVGKYFISELKKLKNEYDFIKEVRGKGLMIGVELSIDGREIVNKALEKGLLINCVHDKILRFLPPLIINKKHVDRAINILKEIFEEKF